jgi:signal transduction histidine kinase
MGPTNAKVKQMALSAPRPHRGSRYVWSIGVFVTILAITAVLHVSERARIEDARAQLLAVNATQVADDVEAALEDYTGGARAAAALIQNDPTISQEDYERAMANVVRSDRSEAITATNVVKQIARVDLQATIDMKVHIDGAPFTPFPERKAEVYAPVWLLYPLQGNESARGFDILANQAAVRTLESSLRSNEPRMTPGLTIVQETEDQIGFIIYVPTIGPDFEGWTNAVFRGQQFLENVLGDVDTVAVSVSDGPGVDSKVIGRITPRTPDEAVAEQLTLTRTIYGQEWVFDIAATSVLTDQVPDAFLFALTIGGIGLAGLASVFVFLLIRQRELAETLVVERTAELVDANSRLVEAGRIKDDFLAVVSHELRTPLTVIMGMADMASEETSPDSGARQYLDRIDHNARRMGDLVEDLLLTAQIDAGKLETRPQTVPLKAALEGLAADLNKTVNGDIDVDVATGDNVLVDPSHLERMISNLVTNAEKYGSPPIRIQARIEDRQAVIQVIDSGPGVPEHQVPALFERFEQGTSGRRRTSSGVGLGLSIVRELAEINGGSARYVDTSSPIFEIRLPSSSWVPAAERTATATA